MIIDELKKETLETGLNLKMGGKYRESPISAVFWSLGHRTIRGTALIED